MVAPAVVLCAAALAGCSGAPDAVPSASAFAIPSVDGAGVPDQAAACAAQADRAAVVACLLPLAEDLLAQAYAPIVTSRGLEFTRPTVSMAPGGAETKCGKLSSVSYCPQDHVISLPVARLVSLGDRSATEVEWGAETKDYFASKLTTGQLAQGGPYGAIMALSHEYGHHVQTLIGYEQINANEMKAQPDKAAYYSSEFELMADCFAGWSAGVLDAGKAFDVTPQDQWAAITALAEVGDDFIQENRGGASAGKSTATFDHGAANERANAWVDGAGLGLDGKEPYAGCLALVDGLMADRAPSGAASASASAASSAG